MAGGGQTPACGGPPGAHEQGYHAPGLGTTFLASSHTGPRPPAPWTWCELHEPFPAGEVPPGSQRRQELWETLFQLALLHRPTALCCLDAHEAPTTTARPRILLPGNCLPQVCLNPITGSPSPLPLPHSSRSNPEDLQPGQTCWVQLLHLLVAFLCDSLQPTHLLYRDPRPIRPAAQHMAPSPALEALQRAKPEATEPAFSSPLSPGVPAGSHGSLPRPRPSLCPSQQQAEPKPPHTAPSGGAHLWS